MASFSVFVPSDPQPRPDKIVFLRDGFSIPAMVRGPFWLLWKRAWLPAGAIIVILLLLPVLAKLTGTFPLLPLFLAPALALWLGFEGRQIQGWSLKRRGYLESDIVVAENEEEAEEIYFARTYAVTGAKAVAENAA